MWFATPAPNSKDEPKKEEAPSKESKKEAPAEEPKKKEEPAPAPKSKSAPKKAPPAAAPAEGQKVRARIECVLFFWGWLSVVIAGSRGCPTGGGSARTSSHPRRGCAVMRGSRGDMIDSFSVRVLTR